MDTIEMVLFLLLTGVVLVVHCLAPFWIGRAARKRGKGYVGWIVFGLFLGPMIVGFIYALTANRAPVLLGHENDPVF